MRRKVRRGAGAYLRRAGRRETGAIPRSGTPTPQRPSTGVPAVARGPGGRKGGGATRNGGRLPRCSSSSVLDPEALPHLLDTGLEHQAEGDEEEGKSEGEYEAGAHVGPEVGHHREGMSHGSLPIYV